MLRVLPPGITFPDATAHEGYAPIEDSLLGRSIRVASPVLSDADVEWLERGLTYRLHRAVVEAKSRLRPDQTASPAGRSSIVHLMQVAGTQAETWRLEWELEEHFRQLLGERLGSRSALHEAIAGTCVTTSPGEFLDISSLRDIFKNRDPDHDPNLPLNVPIMPASGDQILMEIFPAVSPPPLREDTVAIGLGSAVDWGKQLMQWTTCPPHQHQYVETKGKQNAHWMVLAYDNGISAIVFRKPKAFGIWFDICYMEASDYLNIFGGRYTRFTWYRD